MSIGVIKATTGEIYLVDADDAERLSGYKYRTIKIRHNFYAIRTENRRNVYLHNDVMRVKPRSGWVVDHINPFSMWDCRKSNLRKLPTSANVRLGKMRERLSKDLSGVRLFNAYMEQSEKIIKEVA